MPEKLLGYLLLSVGLLIISFAGISTIRVFTNRAPAINVFTLPPIALNAEGLPGQVELLSGEVLTKTTNVFAHLFLMGFVASLGSKVASIGVQLVRPIHVHVNTKDAATT